MNDSWVNKLTKTSMHSSRMRTAPLLTVSGGGSAQPGGLHPGEWGDLPNPWVRSASSGGGGGVCPILGESAWGGVGQTPLPPVNRMTDRQV